MRKILIGMIMVVSFSLTMLLPTLSYSAPQDDQVMIPHWWERSKIVQKLKIPEEKIARIQDLTKDDMKQSSKLRNTLRQQRADLYKLLVADDFDVSAVKQQSEKTLSTFSSLMKMEADIQIKAVKELTVEQRRDLLKMKDNIGEAIKKRIQDKIEK